VRATLSRFWFLRHIGRMTAPAIIPEWIFAHGDSQSDSQDDAARDAFVRDERANAGEIARLALTADHPDYPFVQRVRAGDKVAFEHIYRDMFQSLCDFALIYLRRTDVCGDIVNDVFANVWAHHTAWSPQRGIAPYLRGAVRNRVRNFLRDAVRAEQRADAWALGEEVSGPAPDVALEARETAARIWRAVARLPEQRQLVITLRWQQQLDIAEIAEHLGVSEGAVRVQLSRALAQLRALLETRPPSM
jgi:RNA polymerase sigma-70 factor (ECF subfamily)